MKSTTKYNINPNCEELIKSGKCKANCCGLVPFPERHWQQLKHLIKGKNVQIIPFGVIQGQRYVLPTTENLSCVFLNSEYGCSIYKSPMRPIVCKMFGTMENDLPCPHINEGKKELMSQQVSERIKRLQGVG